MAATDPRTTTGLMGSRRENALEPRGAPTGASRGTSVAYPARRPLRNDQGSRSGLITELSGRGLVRAAGVLTGGNGRPSKLVELNAESAYGLALSVEADRFSAVVTNLEGRVIAERIETADVAALGLHRSMDELAYLAGKILTDELPVGVTISVPGLVDSAAAVLRFAPTLRWRDAEIADLMAARLGLTADAITVDNEANLGAVGESVVGVGAGVRELFYLSGGIGVGGGLVSGGVILRGARGFAGEVGHITVDPSGEQGRAAASAAWRPRPG